MSARTFRERILAYMTGCTVEEAETLLNGNRDEVIAEYRAQFTMTEAREIARNHRAAVLAEVTAWLTKKAREYRADGTREGRAQADTAAVLASKISRGAVRPNNLRMLPNPGFFEVDRTYRHGGNEFRVLAVDPHPVRGDLTAIGWLVEPDGTCLIFRMTALAWESGKWADVTEEAAR